MAVGMCHIILPSHTICCVLISFVYPQYRRLYICFAARPHVTIDHGRPCFDKYPKAPTPYRYLNSGTWIGKAAPSAAMLHAVQVEAGKDFANANDQELVANMFIEGRFGIALDYHAQLFQSMHLTLDKPLPRCKPIEVN